MIKHDEVIERALKAIELVAATFSEDEDVIFAAVAEAIRLEFTICRDWRAEEHRAGCWSLRNERTGERYRVRARGLKANRLVTFKVKAQAERAAYRRNLAETPNP